MLLLDSILRIVAAGGGLVIDLEKNILFHDAMIQIAATASHSGAQVTFKVGNRPLLPDLMVQVAAAGRGRVIFDIT